MEHLWVDLGLSVTGHSILPLLLVWLWTRKIIFLMVIGTPGTGNGQFNNPFELAIDSGNNLYVVDNDNNRVQVFDNAGKYLTQFGNSGVSHERLQDPVGIAVDSLGDAYVADGRDSDIHVFTPI